MESKTLLHIETDADHPAGAGIAICSLVKNRSAEADAIMALPKVLQALRKFNAFYDDLAKSNPGFMGKLCLQDYALWNEALYESERVLSQFPESSSK